MYDEFFFFTECKPKEETKTLSFTYVSSHPKVDDVGRNNNKKKNSFFVLFLSKSKKCQQLLLGFLLSWQP